MIGLKEEEHSQISISQKTGLAEVARDIESKNQDRSRMKFKNSLEGAIEEEISGRETKEQVISLCFKEQGSVVIVGEVVKN